MVKLSLEMKKRDVVWASLVGILLGAGLVFAFTYDGSGEPSVMGHSLDELNLTGFGGGSGFSCDSGFTKIGNLGCMQETIEDYNGDKLIDGNDEANWRVASIHCFTKHGGRLPTAQEWNIATQDANVDIDTQSSGIDYELVASGLHRDGVSGNAEFYAIDADSTGIDKATNMARGKTNKFRCFIPA